MAKQQSSIASFIFPSMLLLGGVVLLILWMKARKQQKAAEEMGLAVGSGSGYNPLSAAELKKLTTITI